MNTVIAACAVLTAATSLNAQVEITPSGNDHVSIAINGQPFSVFFIGNAYSKPFLAPLRSATGVVVTRKFPMERVEGESRDHPHHKGLWIGYGDVNGINFWETEPESKASGSNPADKGNIRLKELGQTKSGSKSGKITATFAWIGPGGSAVLEEQRTLTFYADKTIRRLDVDSTFSAKTSVSFADTKEGFFAIRVADSMSGKNGGIITNAEGSQTEKDVWGKRADWADYVGTVEGQKLGILILDNPANPNHPPRWHARDYGLFAVNPFGVKDFDPKSDTRGGYQMHVGQSARFRYRVIVHSGDESKKSLAHWYSDYISQTR